MVGRWNCNSNHQTMSHLTDLQGRVENLRLLLADAHPGLYAWRQAYESAVSKLLDFFDAAPSPAGEPCGKKFMKSACILVRDHEGVHISDSGSAWTDAMAAPPPPASERARELAEKVCQHFCMVNSFDSVFEGVEPGGTFPRDVNWLANVIESALSVPCVASERGLLELAAKWRDMASKPAYKTHGYLITCAHELEQACRDTEAMTVIGLKP